jgi:hypothetical protein
LLLLAANKASRMTIRQRQPTAGGRGELLWLVMFRVRMPGD